MALRVPPFSILISAALLWGSAGLVLASSPPDPDNGASVDETVVETEGELRLGSDEIQEILPPDLSNDELIVFFSAFSTNESIVEALDLIMLEAMNPGPTVPDWETSGINMLEELEALEGGIKANLLKDLDPSTPTVVDYSGQARPDLSGFASYAIKPEPSGLVTERTFMNVFPGVWFEGAAQTFQKGNALCNDSYFGLTLHTKRHYSAWTENELLVTAFMLAVFDQAARMEFCVVYDKAEDGTYSSRAYLMDGSSLPQLDEVSSPSVIMPVGELKEFLQGR